MSTPGEYLKEISCLLQKVSITTAEGEHLSYDAGIEKIVEMFTQCKRERRGVFFCGNGGSAGIAQHMTADYMKNGGIQTHSLYEPTTLTCISNDFTYESVFSRQLELMVHRGDMLIAISSSGESENILNAIQMMRVLEGNVITLTGFREHNRIRSKGDMNIYVPKEHYGMVESIHNLLLQQIVDIIAEKAAEGPDEGRENL